MALNGAGNVVGLDGGAPPPSVTGVPNLALIATLENVLSRAKTGELQSFVGVGFVKAGDRLSVWAGHHSNVYEMLGSINWLAHEYVDRTTGNAV